MERDIVLQRVKEGIFSFKRVESAWNLYVCCVVVLALKIIFPAVKTEDDLEGGFVLVSFKAVDNLARCCGMIILNVLTIGEVVGLRDVLHDLVNAPNLRLLLLGVLADD